MGQCVWKALLGAKDINALLRAAKCIMFGNAQPLNQVKQWLRALPDAVPHGLQHPIGGGAQASLRGQNDRFFNFALKVLGASRKFLIGLRQHQSAPKLLRESHTILGAKLKS